MKELDPFGAFVDRSAEGERRDGALSNVRLAVKDNIAVEGLKWTAGLPLLANRLACRDATAVARLRAAGARIVGTVATDSAGFGMMTPGVINPIAPGRTAGGSSGGSAAAVAGGLAELSLGTDTGGSVRVPAACCGLFGLKPTYGRVPVDGITPLSWEFDHVGLLAADLDYLEAGWRALIQTEVPAPSTVSTVGFDPARLALADSVIRDSVYEAVVRLGRSGLAVREIALPGAMELGEVHGAVVCAEAIEIWREHWPRDEALFTPTARRSLSYAAALTPAETANARRMLVGLRAAIAAIFTEVDAILGPTLIVEPPLVGAHVVQVASTRVPVIFGLLAETATFNLSGHPALALPLATMTSCGAPVSLQIATRPDEELTAIALARAIGAAIY